MGHLRCVHNDDATLFRVKFMVFSQLGVELMMILNWPDRYNLVLFQASTPIIPLVLAAISMRHKT